MFGIPEVVETTADTRKRLSKKTDKELMELLMSVDRSIREGWDHAIYFQEWSVGTDILRQRGYGYLSPNDIVELYNKKWR